MIDGKPRIGDEVYIHGYIDEIRNDVVIIRNEGGYFGTSDREIFYYEEDERGYGTMNEADRKTEPQYSEDDMYWLSLAEDVANGKMSDAGANQAWLEYINRKTEPTISKMEQVDKDINVRSKDEPTTQTETQNSNLTFEKRTMRDCYNCKRYETEGECIECHYEPKDEPQTDCAWK